MPIKSQEKFLTQQKKYKNMMGKNNFPQHIYFFYSTYLPPFDDWQRQQKKSVDVTNPSPLEIWILTYLPTKSADVFSNTNSP